MIIIRYRKQKQHKLIANENYSQQGFKMKYLNEVQNLKIETMKRSSLEFLSNNLKAFHYDLNNYLTIESIINDLNNIQLRMITHCSTNFEGATNILYKQNFEYSDFVNFINELTFLIESVDESIKLLNEEKMNKYFSVVGFIDNDYEVLFGSFDRADCVSEIECEKSSWKDQGYKRIKIQSKTTTDVPDRSIYKNIVSNTDFSCYVDAKNDGEIFDYIADDLISNCGNDFFINDEKLLKDVNQFLVGKINIQFSNCDQVIEAIEKNDKRIKLIIDTDKNQYVYNCLVEFIDDTKLFMQFAVAGSFITHDQTSIETYVEMFNLKASK